VIVADPAFGAPDAAASRYFAPLPGTAREAEQVRTALQRATVLTQHAASKAALARLAAPQALHIATHGFFLTDAKIDNPLLRSGLALAGANGGTRAGGGLMTALEAANLDLWGTNLVTLSACDTGLGTVRNGEGVYGMRRAFVLAGAETLVMSLWPISDYVTRQMMAAYYRGLKTGLGRGESLRKAQLALQADPRRRHPYYWASFIQAGDWTPLKGY
jgi:CHAT domain-containing protein